MLHKSNIGENFYYNVGTKNYYQHNFNYTYSLATESHPFKVKVTRIMNKL